MPHLERLVDVNQLISYPAAGLETVHSLISPAVARSKASENGRRFNNAYENAEDLMAAARNLKEVYVVVTTFKDELFFTIQVEENIGEGKPYKLTDIVAVVRRR